MVDNRSERGGRRRAGTRAELEQRGMEVFGPRLHRLPWAGAEAAAKGLERAERVQFDRARGLLDQSWLEDPLTGLVGAMKCMCRGTVIVHSGARSRLPTWLIHDHGGQPSTSLPTVFGDRKFDMGAARLYSLEGRDRFADRPVNLSTLATDFEKMPALHQLLSHAGLHHQLRVVTYDSNQVLAGYFGMYLPQGEPAYSISEHQLFHAAFPLLRRWLLTSRVLGIAPLAETGLTTALDANREPSYLIRDDGAVVFANRSARRLPFEGGRFLEQTPGAHSIGLLLCGQSFRLVTLPTPGPPSRTAEKLPRALERVRGALSRGFSDKEIADELNMPLATIRTYVQRVYRKLGVSSRRELIKLDTECRSLPQGGASGDES